MGEVNLLLWVRRREEGRQLKFVYAEYRTPGKICQEIEEL